MSIARVRAPMAPRQLTGRRGGLVPRRAGPAAAIQSGRARAQRRHRRSRRRGRCPPSAAAAPAPPVVDHHRLEKSAAAAGRVEGGRHRPSAGRPAYERPRPRRRRVPTHRAGTCRGRTASRRSAASARPEEVMVRLGLLLRSDSPRDGRRGSVLNRGSRCRSQASAAAAVLLIVVQLQQKAGELKPRFYFVEEEDVVAPSLKAGEVLSLRRLVPASPGNEVRFPG